MGLLVGTEVQADEGRVKSRPPALTFLSSARAGRAVSRARVASRVFMAVVRAVRGAQGVTCMTPFISSQWPGKVHR